MSEPKRWTLDDTIKELEGIAADRLREEQQERMRNCECPYCGAALRIESNRDLPDDTKLAFVRRPETRTPEEP